jgi:Esterase/lipase
MSEAIPLWEGTAPFYNPEWCDGEIPRITPYLIPSDKPLGCVIVLPGGGYVCRAPHEGEPIALMINAAGYNAFVCDYRVMPYSHPVPLCDANRAVRFVRHNAARFNCDPDKIGILGFSAGGHLSVSACEHYGKVIGDAGYMPDAVDKESARPDAGVFCYAVVSLCRHTHGGSMQNLTGGDEKLAELLSGEVSARPDMPPAFLWHTLDDEAVPVENALDMTARMHELGVPCELHIYPHGQHGLGLAEGNPVVSQWTGQLANWLKYSLKW